MRPEPRLDLASSTLRRWPAKTRARAINWREAAGKPACLRGTAVAPVQKVGRNDPCPCGSGKKYKRCCLGREEGRDAFARLVRERALPLLESLAKFAEESVRAPLATVASREFPFWRGGLDEQRAARVLDYLMFDYRPAGIGRRTVDEFAIQRGPQLNADQQALLENWSASTTRIYAVKDWSGGFVRCRDVLADPPVTIEVMQLQGRRPLPEGQVVALRALPLGDRYFCVGEPLQFGARSADEVASAIRARHLDYVRRRRIMGIDEFLRVEPKVVDEEAFAGSRASGIILARP